MRISRIFALRGIYKKEVLAHSKACVFDIGLQHLAGRAGPCGAFQRQHLALPEIWCDCFHRRNHKAKVRFARLVQWCRYANNQRIAIGGSGEISRCLKAISKHCSNLVGRDVLYWTASSHQLGNSALQDIKTNNFETTAARSLRQWDTNIAKPKNTDHGLTRFKCLKIRVHFFLSWQRLKAYSIDTEAHRTLGDFEFAMRHEKYMYVCALVSSINMNQLSPAHVFW